MPETAAPLAADWDALIRGFTCPAWFRDAKFGVWSHWGPQSVPGQGDWYARYMYQQGHPSYLYHCRTYGHPSVFGYKDIVQRWRAEKFDAESLVGFFAENGAKYFMGQAAHCDNFDLFDSRHHRWNSVNMGPKRDILGEYARAARSNGLHWGFSEHLAWSYCWFQTNKGADTSGPYAGVPYDGSDPAYEDLYFEPHSEPGHAYPRNPSDSFVKSWQSRLIDAIDRYEPDIFYTDGAIFGRAGLELMAHFYDHVARRTGGRNGVYTYKNVKDRRAAAFKGYIGDFRPGAGVEDLEHGVLGGIMDVPWQTDTSSGPWYWAPTAAYKSPADIVHMLVDIVSKNGNLLLNYTQRPDGSLDDETTWIVERVGAWLRANGEAIYGTRPWDCFGEGGHEFPEGEMGLLDEAVAFDATDFRFTTKGRFLYVIALGRPALDDCWHVKSLAGRSVKHVSLLGYEGGIDWQQQPDGLRVDPPKAMPGDLAWSIKVELA